MTPAQDPRRVMLIEFINTGQFPGRISEGFPFIAGSFTEIGVPVRWLRFGIPTTHFLEHGRDAVTFSDDELARLLGIVDDFRPTVLFCTDTIYAPQRKIIEAHAPGIKFRESLVHNGDKGEAEGTA